jgi:serine/threonine protein kinase
MTAGCLAIVSYEVMRVQDITPERLGPYRVIRRLGQGGMGVVYLAQDADGQSVAVKALHPGMAQEENARRRLAREVDTMHRVRSPYVAEVLGADLGGDPPYIVTRYVPGLTLDAVISAGGPLTGAALGRLAYGLAQALAAVHAAGVVHRDLKPGNVMITDGEPVVIDFGIAQLAETTRLTVTGMFMGTPGYLAPEVIEGKDSGPGSDVHSWGATVAYAATGRPPFGTGAFEAIFFRIMHSQPDLDTLPVPLRDMVLRALSRDPATRPSAAELVRWVAALDPASLVPSPVGLNCGLNGGLPVGENAAPLTITDQADLRAWPSSTRPLGNVSPDDVRDLLPPVNYSALGAGPVVGNGANGGAGQGRPAWPALAGYPALAQGPATAGQFGNGQAAAGQVAPAGESPFASDRSAGGTRSAAPVSPWSPLVIASVVIVAAISIMAPIAGTAIGLLLFIALRALATTSRQLARRAAGGGGRAGLSFAALVLFPLSVLRALIGLVLLAPVALLGCCVTVAATIIAVPVHPLPQALAFGAGVLIAIVGLGPGSSGSRAMLADIYSSVARTRSLRAVAYVGVLSVCTWAGITAWNQSSAAAYWPVVGLHAQLEQLPTLRHILTDVRNSLLNLARQFGL